MNWRVFIAVSVMAATFCLLLSQASASTGQQRVTLEVWSWGSPPASQMAVLEREYMRLNPRVTIKHVVQPFDSYFTLVRSRIAARSGPDVLRMYAAPSIFDFHRGLLSLGPYVTNAERRNIYGWDQVSAKNGTPYAMPFNGQGYVFYYNKALFRRAGLSANDVPLTWRELLSVCAALRNAGVVPISAGFKDGYYAEWLGDIIAKQFFRPAEMAKFNQSPRWTQPALVRALRMILELKQKGCFTPDSEGIPLLPDAVNNFAAGNAAMFLGQVSNSANWNQFRTLPVGQGDNIGAFLPPVVPGSRYQSPQMHFGAGGSFAVTSWTKQRAAAVRYVKWLASPRAQRLLFNVRGTLPVSRTVTVTTQDPLGAQIIRWSKNLKTSIGPYWLIRANVEAVFDQLVPEVIAGRLTPEALFARVQTEQARARPVPDR